MSPVRAEDLPPAVRERLGLEATTTGRKKPSRAGVGNAVGCPGHCGCGQAFDRYTDWERHAQATGCRHWRIDLPIPKETPQREA